MYYYVTEPLTTKAERRKIEEIKSLLAQLGIAGEFAVASPARSVEECLDLAFAKGFTTIVAIGSDALACRVATQMLLKHYDRAALGVIPLQSDQALWSMIGAKDLRQIGELLRLRRVREIDALEVGPKQMIIVDGVIHLDAPVRFQLRYNQVQLEGQLTDLLARLSGDVTFWDAQAGQSGGLWGRLFGSRTLSETGKTHFVADYWQLATEKPCHLTISGQEVAETPLLVKRRPKALKLIINRATITPEKASHQSKEI